MNAPPDTARPGADPGNGPTRLRIRPAAHPDAPALADLGARTFRDAFAADNRPDDLDAFLAATYGVAQQAAELDDPSHTTLLAEVDGGLVGFAQLRLGPAPACVTGPAPVELRRFYVVREWHGRGVAGRLMDAIAAAARDRGAATLWLGVWERNERAKAFYRKSGFDDVGSKSFQVGNDLQTDRVMVRPLASADPARAAQ